MHFCFFAYACTGYSRDEVVGKNVNMLMPESLAVTHDSKIEEYMTTKKSNMIGAGSRLVTVRVKNGDLVPCTIVIDEEIVEDEYSFHACLRILTSLEAIITINQQGRLFKLS